MKTYTKHYSSKVRESAIRIQNKNKTKSKAMLSDCSSGTMAPLRHRYKGIKAPWMTVDVCDVLFSTQTLVLNSEYHDVHGLK